MKRAEPWQTPAPKPAPEPTPGERLDRLEARLKRGATSWYDVADLNRDAAEAIAVLRDVVARAMSGRRFGGGDEPVVVDGGTWDEPAPETERVYLQLVVDQATSIPLDRTLVEFSALDLEAAEAVAKHRDAPPTPQETAPR